MRKMREKLYNKNSLMNFNMCDEAKLEFSKNKHLLHTNCFMFIVFEISEICLIKILILYGKRFVLS